jgi:hypothetical protein
MCGPITSACCVRTKYIPKRFVYDFMCLICLCAWFLMTVHLFNELNTTALAIKYQMSGLLGRGDSAFKTAPIMESFKFPARCGPCGLAYAVSCDVRVLWLLLTDISGQHAGPILNGQTVFLAWLTLKYGTDILFQNVDRQLPNLGRSASQKAEYHTH